MQALKFDWSFSDVTFVKVQTDWHALCAVYYLFLLESTVDIALSRASLSNNHF